MPAKRDRQLMLKTQNTDVETSQQNLDPGHSYRQIAAFDNPVERKSIRHDCKIILYRQSKGLIQYP
jgi:hypothetical protein